MVAMIVLDGRVLIAHLERTHPLHDVVSPFIERERDDAFAITAVTATSGAGAWARAGSARCRGFSRIRPDRC
jgi:hypothetical protein